MSDSTCNYNDTISFNVTVDVWCNKCGRALDIINIDKCGDADGLAIGVKVSPCICSKCFKSKRNGKWENIEVEHLTDEERKSILQDDSRLLGCCNIEVTVCEPKK